MNDDADVCGLQTQIQTTNASGFGNGVDSLREHSYSHRISYIITLLSRGFRNLKRLSENVDTILLIHSSHILP